MMKLLIFIGALCSLLLMVPALSLLKNYEINIVVSEIFKRCDEYPNPGVMDLSNLKFVQINDSHTYMNGSVKYLKTVSKPWKTRITWEKKYRGSWHINSFDRTYDDFCFSVRSPFEPFHLFWNDVPYCPITAGTDWMINMILIEFPKILRDRMTDYYEGQWRLTANFQTKVDGKTYIDCFWFYADVWAIVNGNWGK